MYAFVHKFWKLIFFQKDSVRRLQYEIETAHEPKVEVFQSKKHIQKHLKYLPFYLILKK